MTLLYICRDAKKVKQAQGDDKHGRKIERMVHFIFRCKSVIAVLCLKITTKKTNSVLSPWSLNLLIRLHSGHELYTFTFLKCFG